MVTPPERWKSFVIDTLSRIASEEDQRLSWFKPDHPEPTTPLELFATLFDDYDFDEFVESNEVGMTESARTAAIKFRTKITEYAQNWTHPPDPKFVIDDPAWREVRSSASKLLESLKEVSDV